MPVIETPLGEYQYESPRKDYLMGRIAWLKVRLKEFLRLFDEVRYPEDVYVDFHGICNAIIRVDKRREYFKIFHEQTRINEIKETALLTYWLFKYRPIHILPLDASGSINRALCIKYRNFNEGFAMSLLYAAIRAKARIRKGRIREIPDSCRERMMYAVTHYDISKEELILLSECICDMMCS